MAKISNRTANPFIWMANSIGEIVEKQKNEKVTLLFGTGSSISNPKESEKKITRLLQDLARAIVGRSEQGLASLSTNSY